MVLQLKQKKSITDKAMEKSNDLEGIQQFLLSLKKKTVDWMYPFDWVAIRYDVDKDDFVANLEKDDYNKFSTICNFGLSHRKGSVFTQYMGIKDPTRLSDDEKVVLDKLAKQVRTKFRKAIKEYLAWTVSLDCLDIDQLSDLIDQHQILPTDCSPYILGQINCNWSKILTKEQSAKMWQDKMFQHGYAKQFFCEGMEYGMDNIPEIRSDTTKTNALMNYLLNNLEIIDNCVEGEYFFGIETVCRYMNFSTIMSDEQKQDLFNHMFDIVIKDDSNRIRDEDLFDFINNLESLDCENLLISSNKTFIFDPQTDSYAHEVADFNIQVHLPNIRVLLRNVGNLMLDDQLYILSFNPETTTISSKVQTELDSYIKMVENLKETKQFYAETADKLIANAKMLKQCPVCELGEDYITIY